MIFKEHEEQKVFFRRLSLRKFKGGTLRDYCYAIPNAGTRGGRAAMLAGVRRKAEGVTPGVPDVECFIKATPYAGLHIEFKKSRKDGGKPSDVTAEQHAVMDRMTAEGRSCKVAFGADEAWVHLCTYLGIKP